MASLPPVHEIEAQMCQELMTVLENRGQAEADFLTEVLPSYVDKIKLMGMRADNAFKIQ